MANISGLINVLKRAAARKGTPALPAGEKFPNLDRAANIKKFVHDAEIVNDRNLLGKVALGAAGAGAGGAVAAGVNEMKDNEEIKDKLKQIQAAMTPNSDNPEPKSSVEKVYDTVKNSVNNAYDASKNTLNDAYNSASSSLGNGWDALKGAASDSYNRLDDVTGGHANLALAGLTGLGLAGGVGALNLRKKLRNAR